MKRIFSVSSFLVAFAFLSSCGVNVLRGEGNKTSKTASVSPFDKVDICTSSKINITVGEGNTQSVVLSGYENILKHIKTEVKDNTLFVSYDLDDTWSIDADEMEVRITVPVLKGLSLSGAPDANIHGNVTGTEFVLDASGAGEITIDNMNVDKFVADLSGVAELQIKGGTVKQASYDLSGAGSIEAYPLQTEETVASISGAAKSEVTASKKLDASISGAGSITYKGTPQVTEHISGAGSVSAAGSKD